MTAEPGAVRVVAVRVAANPALAPDLVGAMVDDVVDLVSEMPRVVPVVVTAGSAPMTEIWPGTARVTTAGGASAAALLEVAAAAYVDRPVAVAVVSGDAPDLPALLIGKLFSALGDPGLAQVAVCPAAGGGLVAIASRLPMPPWLVACSVGLDEFDAREHLERLAPARALAIGPGWHRIRQPEDVARLDPGLDGWDATRAYLSL